MKRDSEFFKIFVSVWFGLVLIFKVCSSETTGVSTGVASGSVTSASASIRFHRKRRNNQTGNTRRSMSGAASNASDIASSVDLNEYRSSKLSRKRSSRCVIQRESRAIESNISSNIETTTISTNQSYLNLNTGFSRCISNNTNQNIKELDFKPPIEKINSNLSADVKEKVLPKFLIKIFGKIIMLFLHLKANHLLNSTPMSTPQTPINHKVHFHLNCMTDEDEILIKSAPTVKNGCEASPTDLSNANTSLPNSATRSNVKNNVMASMASHSSSTTQNNELLLEWESYWDSLEYNCLGRINIDF